MSQRDDDHRRDLSRPATLAVVGGGPAGMTAALLLARAGHRVSIFDSARQLGGLWASRLDEDGWFRGDNSCKVYQRSYHTTPALFDLIGARWQDHFTARHDLTADWLRPFVAGCTARDLRVLGWAYVRHLLGRGGYHEVSVSEFMDAENLSDGCRAGMRATALGGIAGTLRMTMWELFHRLGSSLTEIVAGSASPLYWNSRPPNAPGGFMALWARALVHQGVVVQSNSRVARLEGGPGPRGVTLTLEHQSRHGFDGVFLAVPPPALGALLRASSDPIARGFGLAPSALDAYLGDSVYTHLGVTWFFDREFPNDLPLGGHNVRRGWYPILVQHDQYRRQLRPPAVSVVVGSVAVDTEFRHPRLGTRASDHAHEELAAILWDDERRLDPSLPEPIDIEVMGTSSASQVVRAGTLPVRMEAADIFLATNLHGLAPYFTASLESAIQAGAIAAARFDPRVEQLPTGRRSPRRTPWSA